MSEDSSTPSAQQYMHKPSEQVRRFFDKSSYEKYNGNNKFSLKKKEKLFVEEKGTFYDNGRKDHNYDEKTLNAIDKRQQKQMHTDFFYKLDELKDRIEVYNDMFRSNVPSFMRKSQKRKIQDTHIREQSFQLQNQNTQQQLQPIEAQGSDDIVKQASDHEDSNIEILLAKQGNSSAPKSIKVRHNRNKPSVSVSASFKNDKSIDQLPNLNKKDINVGSSVTVPKLPAKLIDPLKQVTIERRLNISAKYQESIQRANENQKKTEDIKSKRLHSIETKITSPRIKSIDPLAHDSGDISPRVAKKKTKGQSPSIDQSKDLEESMNRLSQSKSKTAIGKAHQPSTVSLSVNQSLVELANKKHLGKAVAIKKRELSSSPLKNSLDQIKSIYETNILKDPIFNPKQRSQLRNWKQHTTRGSISPTMRIREGLLDSINDKAIEEGEEKSINKAKKTEVSPNSEAQVKLLPKIEQGITETVLPVMSAKRLGKNKRVHSNQLSVIAERSSKQSKKVNLIQKVNEAKHQNNQEKTV